MEDAAMDLISSDSCGIQIKNKLNSKRSTILKQSLKEKLCIRKDTFNSQLIKNY